jgi:cytochrome c oxidase subunit 3
MIFRQLTDRPWEPVPGGIDDRYRDGIASLPAAAIGLRMFLAVVTVLFMLLIIAYGARMVSEDWRPSPESSLLWLNTGVLIISSAAMQFALIAARRNRVSIMKNALLAGGVSAFVFLAGQILAWRQLATSPYFDVTNPAIAFFYLITALHALHILGGIVAWGRTTFRVWGGFDMTQIRLNVELCTLYWHYLLLIWLVLFALLFSGNDNLSAFLAICGLK